MIWFFKKKDKDKNEKQADESGADEVLETEETLEEEFDREAAPDIDITPPAPSAPPDGTVITPDEPDVLMDSADVLPEVEEETTAKQAADEYEQVQHYADAAPTHALDASIDDTPEQSVEPAAENKKSWLTRLTSGLAKSSSKMTESITSVITKRKLDDETLEELEEALIVGDLGPSTAARLTGDLAASRFGKDVTDEEVREALAEGIIDILAPVAKPLEIGAGSPHVILFAGVNGTGKTTTIGKLAKRFTDEGKSVMLAAGDTFRAAAVEQLKVWGDRTGCPVVAKDIGADAGALAYEAMDAAKQAGVDVLLVDTAGRLQNKSNLMDELQKVVRVIQKHDENAPHQTLLVLDATTGQNAHSQVELFDKAVDVTGLIVTKLDGTAKGGVIVSLADKYKKPIHAIGVGESVEDLHAFKADDFARSLMGL